jgi:Zn-finger nucleic acid-binding protein
MQCPVCKKKTMDQVIIEQDLHVAKCMGCTGIWIARAQYEAWRSRHPADMPEWITQAELTAIDVPGAKLCPECGHVLLKYRVGHGLEFSIEYCGACGGIWLDQNEWTAIKAKNLHDKLHQVVSAKWQADIRKQKVQESIEQTYARLLGNDYDRAKDMKAWIAAQSNKSVILAYLSDASS